ncbi:MAG: hypothetical protein KGK35_04945 [Xanthomonadaceae bacterium]|nr:hypothetical protein [Xanthomonadaceae bacterium]MDE2497157.1 hypothetical protein [Xanthomonadaceae bacterium]
MPVLLYGSMCPPVFTTVEASGNRHQVAPPGAPACPLHAMHPGAMILLFVGLLSLRGFDARRLCWSIGALQSAFVGMTGT